jgi:hypothetical protein
MAKLTLKQVAAIVEAEDLGYALQYYMTEENIADPKLKKIWKETADGMNAIDKMLDEYYNH